MKILLIEDDAEKGEIIREFLEANISGAFVSTARSITSGLLALTSDQLDLLVLDMSMPNFDASIDTSAGNIPENYAGRDLLAQMQLRGISVPTIVVTMFVTFGEGDSRMSVQQLAKSLQKYSPQYRGLVQYSLAEEGWRAALLKLVSSVRKGK